LEKEFLIGASSLLTWFCIKAVRLSPERPIGSNFSASLSADKGGSLSVGKTNVLFGSSGAACVTSDSEGFIASGYYGILCLISLGLSIKSFNKASFCISLASGGFEF